MTLTSDINETRDVSKVRVELLIIHRDYLAGCDPIKVKFASLRLVLCG